MHEPYPFISFYRYDILRSDIFRGINDTTNSALLTGRLISSGRVPDDGSRNSCFMHTQELALTHAFGLRDRKRNGDVTDSFLPGKAIRDRVRKLCSTIMNRKSKGCFNDYSMLCKDEHGFKALVLELPNETRISGTFRMFNSCLRAKELIMEFCSQREQKFGNLLLTDSEWQFLAEIEAVMKYTNVLAMQVQVDRVGDNCFSYYCVKQCCHELTSFSELSCCDVRQQWTANCLPSDIPQIKTRRDRLLKDTLNFIDRLVAEYNNYFPKPDSDMELMMWVHPIMQWNGIS